VRVGAVAADATGTTRPIAGTGVSKLRSGQPTFIACITMPICNPRG
jgi:hypothetical protein